MRWCVIPLMLLTPVCFSALAENEPVKQNAIELDAGRLIRDTIQAALDGDSGQIRENRIAFGQSVHVPANETLKDGLAVFGGSAVIEGNVAGDVIVFGGNARITGWVDGDVVVVGGNVDLTGSARISGSVLYLGGALNREPDAVVAEEIVNLTLRSFDALDGSPLIQFSIMRLATLFNTIAVIWWGIVSFLVTILFNRQIEQASHTMINHPIRTTFTGLAFHIGAVAAIVFLIVIKIGIPLSLFAFLAWFITCIFAVPVGFATLGNWIYRRMNRPDTSVLIACLTGFIILSLLRFLPYCLGCFIWHIWALAAIGATILSGFGSDKPWFPSPGNRLSTD